MSLCLSLPFQQSFACLTSLEWFEWCAVSDHSAVFSRIYLQPYLQYLSSSDLFFSPSISLDSRWCIHTIVSKVLKEIQFYLSSERTDFHVIDNLSKTSPANSRCMLILLCVYKILLPPYMSWSPNFNGLPFNEMAPSWLNLLKAVLSEFT